MEIFDSGNGKHCLTIIDTDIDDRTYELFEEHSLHGGGYTWRGVLWSLIEMYMPTEADSLTDIGAEADNAYVYSADCKKLERLSELFRSALEDHEIIKAAIAQGGGEIE